MRPALALLPLLLVLAAPAAAAPLTIISPIYSQLVALPLPEPFQPGPESEHDGSYLLEFAPKGETVESWSELITVSGARGLAAQASVQDVAAQIAQGYQAACPDSFSAKGLPAPRIKGAVAVFAGYLSCGTYEGQSESMAFLILQGQQEIYTLQWAAHGPASDGPMALDAGLWSPRLAALAKARICDKVAGEAAPYPSCTP